MDPESINSVFVLFDCFGAILYESHGPGLSVRCIRGLRRGCGEQGKKRIYFMGTEVGRPNFEGNKDNIGEQGT